MDNTLTLISTVTVGAGGAASIDFTSIPQIYTDLLLLTSDRTSNTGGLGWYDYGMTFNGSSSGYSNKFSYGSGSSIGTSNDGSTSFIVRTAGSSATAGVFGSGSIYIANYAGSTHKVVSQDNVSENNGTSSIQCITAGIWANTSAITSISLTGLGGGTLVEHSSASLYGILKGSGGATVS